MDKKWIEIIGVVSIVASLVFVGIQIQQTNEATRSATVLQLKDSWVQLNLASATSIELAEAFHDVSVNGWDVSSYQSRDLVAGFQRTRIHNWSNAFFQYKNGTLDESQWIPIQREVAAAASDDSIRRVWLEWSHVYDDDFRDLVDREIGKEK